MSEVKQVKVDNWGIYFLQRLKHFFNRTDFCDLTLQFQDNAQLKVHRLVLSACTEYFEVLERTCEMYEDCLVMPDDLQADVVVPIVNFMYTGQLEFRMDLLEKLHQTSQIMQMPVLTKLLDAHRYTPLKPTQCYTPKRKPLELTPSTSNKRSYSKAFDKTAGHNSEKKVYVPAKNRQDSFGEQLFEHREPRPFNRKINSKDPRPTRYELPEELDTDNVFDNSFCNISYTSKPLMVHPETVKRYSSKRSTLLGEASCSKMFSDATSTMDIVECKKISSDSIFDETNPDFNDNEGDVFQQSYYTVKNNNSKNSNQLFDQILDQNTTTKVTIDTKNSKGAPSLDHAKIISEVLKKYSHLLKGSKNIKLKILNNPDKTIKKQKTQYDKPSVKEEPDFTYETDVLDSKQAAKLIAMGAENIKGPWICLICGTPGRALHFPTYYKFRRHLVDVHKEKPVANICEYCGHKALKRNYLLHHLYSKHNIQPPPQYNFPKCNMCNYIALTEGLLTKHKLTHSLLNFRCNVCSTQFASSRLLLLHIQNTGHKYSADRKNNLQCIYCLKVFLRENSLFTHLKSYHKAEAKSDGIIEDSDEEMKQKEDKLRNDNKYEIKLESSSNIKNEYEEMDVQYQIQSDGNIHVISTKKQKLPLKQKILNSGLSTKMSPIKSKTIEDTENVHHDFLHQTNTTTLNDDDEDEVVTIDNKEYIVKNNHLLPRKTKQADIVEYVVPEILESNHNLQTDIPTTSMEFTSVHSANILDDIQQSGMIVNKAGSLNQPIQFVVSNEEEYKALMSANHPIIFDNSDKNQTLTVLTAPHGTTLDTATINLDSTQSNDMMIIQEEFPLNVPENVTTDNSNIVVVYSHPVTNQSKQYQLITTQGIGSQFVPSSAIITQNYETVTTTTPVVNAHVISTDEVWENEIHQTTNNEELQVAIESEVETVANTEIQISSQDNINEKNVNELPEVHIVPGPQNTIITQASEIDSDLNKPSETSIDGESTLTEQEITQNISDTVSIPVNIDNTSAQHSDGETNVVKVTENSDNVDHEYVTMDESNTKTISNVDTDATLSNLQSSEITENNEEVTIDKDALPFTTVSPTPGKDEENVEIPAENVKLSNDENIEQNQLTNGAIEQIQNLTSEWSEDECENQDQVIKENKLTNSELLVTANQTEIEESIENIQQEIEKNNPAVTVEIENQENDNQEIKNSLEEIVPNENQVEPNENQLVSNTTPNEEVRVSTHENLSSLLNDWEDNDSQEEASTKQMDVNDPNTSVENAQDTVKLEKNDIEDQSNPNDNIKKIVSDWDDDEEENNLTTNHT